MDFGPESPRQAVWIGLARLGDIAAKRHIEKALSHAEVSPYRITGRLEAKPAGRGSAYRLTVVRAKPMKVDAGTKAVLGIYVRTGTTMLEWAGLAWVASPC